MAAHPTRALFRRLLLAAVVLPAAPLAACGARVEPFEPAADAGGDALPDGASCAPVTVSDPSSCGATVTFPCGLPDPVDVGPTSERCQQLCPADAGFFSCWITRDDAGPASVVQCTSCAVGRRPVAHRARAGSRGRSQLGGWLARIAELEAAAVDAFDVLSAELSAHGAPRRLRVEARRARRDEVRHARTIRALARRRGGRPVVGATAARPIRALEDIAIDNAAEGCVRETWGALFASHQAEHATDPALRRAFARIADDETRHASLSWQLHRWALARLAPASRARVEAARAAAIASLRAEIASQVPSTIARDAGAPSCPGAVRLFDAMIAAIG
jgi:hypothetical protein